MKRSLLFFFFLTGLSSFGLHAQCPGPSGGAANCDPLLSQMLISNTPNVEFSFDSFSRINAGLQMIIQNVDLCKLILNYSQQSIILNKISLLISEYYNEQTISITPNEIKKFWLLLYVG
jgi:hypothetical protein